METDALSDGLMTIEEACHFAKVSRSSLYFIAAASDSFSEAWQIAPYRQDRFDCVPAGPSNPTNSGSRISEVVGAVDRTRKPAAARRPSTVLRNRRRRAARPRLGDCRSRSPICRTGMRGVSATPISGPAGRVDRSPHRAGSCPCRCAARSAECRDLADMHCYRDRRVLAS